MNGRYRLTQVDPGSLLATRIGLRAGDEIISVNGHPIAGGFAERRQLFDALRTQRRFTVELSRDGQPTVLSFYVE
jgi:S1-C subfamily serine protease